MIFEVFALSSLSNSQVNQLTKALLVYEGDMTKTPMVDMRMIDFSHVFRTKGLRDQNYITGINYLCKIFKRLNETNRKY